MAEYAFQDWKGGGQTFGNRRMVLVQHTGPTSYTQITPGSAPAAPTGGDSIGAVACGLKWIEAIVVLGDSSGKYTGLAFQPAVSLTGQLNGNGAAATSVPLQWIVSATGAEAAGATNLSTFQLNLIVIGQ